MAGYGSLSPSAPQPLSPEGSRQGQTLRLRAWGLGLGILALSLVAAHCLAGFLVYGTSNTRHAALLTTADLVAQGVEQQWVKEVEPSVGSLEKQATQLLKAQRAVDKDKKDVEGIEKAEASAPKPVSLLQRGVGNSVDSIGLKPSPSAPQPLSPLVPYSLSSLHPLPGLDVPDFKHFESAVAKDDYYQRKHIGREGLKMAQRAARKRQTKLLDPNSLPQEGYPYFQSVVDTQYSNGPAKTWDTEEDDTCPDFIHNCKPQLNTLKECDFTCGSYCQAIRGNGPCFSGNSEGEWLDCKFGYRGASKTPTLTEKEESGWLEDTKHWHKGGPTDCMTCPVGFKIKPLYGDGTGRCEPCDEGWVDSETGLITEPGCGGGQFTILTPGEEPGQEEGSEDYQVVPGCMPTPEVPNVGDQILAKIPDEAKDDPFFADYPSDYYPAKIMGFDAEAEKLAVKFDDGGPFVGYDPGVDAKIGDDFIPMPKAGDKVTVSKEYWDQCCEESYDPEVNGPLKLGDVGEVTSMLPLEANDPTPYTVLAPNGQRYMYGVGQIYKLIGEVKCPLPGDVTGNTVGKVSNQLAELEEAPPGSSEQPPEWEKKVPVDPECCCCTRDLWVGCWGWCGDGQTSKPKLIDNAPDFRAGYGAKTGEVGEFNEEEEEPEETKAQPMALREDIAKQDAEQAEEAAQEQEEDH